MAINLTIRKDAEALIPTQTISDEIIQGVVAKSQALSALRELPRMTTKQAKMPVLGMLPEARFLTGDTDIKPTTKLMWQNKFITAEEIAVIVPIPEAVLDDAEYDIWSQIRPRIEEAFGKAIDEAIFLGKGKPASWREGLIPSIINAGANIQPSTDNLYTQISKAMAKVENSGFIPSAILGGVAIKQAFREGLLDTAGQPLASGNEVVALPRLYMDNGSWDNTIAKFIVGDFSQAVFAIRQDLTFKILDQATLTNGDGTYFSLAEHDCVALRCVMRLGWEVPNAINALNPDEETRFPFALVEPSSAPTTYNVTFTITDTQSTPAPISGVKVVLGGQTKKTNSSGQAVFKSLGSSDYAYVVSKAGLKSDAGVVTVATANKSVAITMVAE